MEKPKRGKFDENPKLSESLDLENSYYQLSRKILLACECINDKTPGKFDLLCEIHPTGSWEKNIDGIKEFTVEDFKIIVFLGSGVEIASDLIFYPISCVVVKNGSVIDGCSGEWEDHPSAPSLGTLNISLPQGRCFSFKHISSVSTSTARVGDYYEGYKSSYLVEKSMKEKSVYLKELEKELGLNEEAVFLINQK